MSPTLLIAVTAPLAALGLYLFGQTTTPAMWYVAAALLAVGTAFWWPTMLGITSERFPAGGALLLAIIGASGSISTAISGPVMGWINETYGAPAVLPTWAILPAVLTVIFGLLYVRDRAQGDTASSASSRQEAESKGRRQKRAGPHGMMFATSPFDGSLGRLPRLLPVGH